MDAAARNPSGNPVASSCVTELNANVLSTSVYSDWQAKEFSIEIFKSCHMIKDIFSPGYCAA